MKRKLYILIIATFTASFSFESEKISNFESKYDLAQLFRSNNEIDSCLFTLFEIKDYYLKANFDIASIYYQDYKNYDIAVYFFDEVINKYESNNNDDFLVKNRDTYKNSIFFSAYIYINDLEMYSDGINRYQLFVDKFPDDELADDAIHELNSLGSIKNKIEILKYNLK